MTRSLRRISAAVLALCAAALLAAQANSSQRPAKRSIILFKDDVAVDQCVRIAQGLGGRVVRPLPLINAVAVETQADRVAAFSRQAGAHPEILSVVDDPKIKWFKEERAVARLPWPNFGEIVGSFKTLIARRPTAVKQPDGSVLPWGVSRVKAPEAWKKTKGEGVNICVIDTGIAYDHPDLQGNVKGGYNIVGKSADFMDDNGHGTHVSGTIAGEGIPGGVWGVAPKASLYGVKVLDANGEGTYDDVIAGMQWCAQNETTMQIASMSLGGPDSPALKKAVAAVAKAGVVLVAAAGNDGPNGKVDYPGAYPGVIAVAALDKNETIADWSSRGKQVALAAPGVDVLSTVPGGKYETMDGTSMATPHVSGLAALAIAAHPGLSGYSALRSALIHSATAIPGATPEMQGNGVPDASILVK